MNVKVNNFLHKIKRSGKKENSIEGDPSQIHLDLGNGMEEGVFESKSLHLAHNLESLLNDSSAFSYFINFMDSCDKLNLIKFWMHVDGFRASLSNIPSNLKTTTEKICKLDSIHIYKKYIDEGSPSTIAIPKKLYSKINAKMNLETLDEGIFDEAYQFVRELFELRFFPEFLDSIYYKKHEFEVLSNENCELMDILRIETLLSSFLELLAENEESHWMEMVLAVDTWEKQSSHTLDEVILEDAITIYDRFFSMQAARTRIPLSDEKRRSLEAQICTENGRPHRDAFAYQKLWALEYLTQKYLQIFRQSFAFQNYLTELSTIIANSIELPGVSGDRKEIREGSIASSSEKESLPSLHSQNMGFLNGEEKHSESPNSSQIIHPLSSTSSNISSKKTAQLAEIDSMGRYTPLYDTTFTSERENAQSKLKMTLRRYLDKSSLREEELAEEVARTIINDIQSMVDSANN